MAKNPIGCLELHAPHLIDAFNKTEGKDRGAAIDLALKDFEVLYKEMEALKKDVQGKNFKPQKYVSPDKSEAIKKINDEYSEKNQIP